MKKKITLALAILMLVSAMWASSLDALASSGKYLGSLQVVNCEEWVTLRSYASTKADTVTRVPLGAWVEAYTYNSEFRECYYNGYHGYILSSHLSSGSGSDSSYLGEMRVAFCNEFVTLRSKPSTKASAVTRIPLGQIVEAYTYNSEYLHCYYCGMEGYILSSYLVPAYDSYDDYEYDEPYMPLTFPEGSRGEWKYKDGNKISMRVKVTNSSRALTVTAFEIYMYAEDVWGDRIYGDTTVYYDTTTKTVAPGSTAFSDYITMPQRSEIYKIYAGVKKVRLSDGTTRENSTIDYSNWTIK